MVAFMAVAALGAVAASGASAHNFRVEGKALTGEVATTGTGGEVFAEWNFTGANMAAVCKQSSFAENLLTEGKLKVGTLIFKECAMTQPAECKMPATLEGEQTGQLATVKTALGIEFKGARSLRVPEELFGFWVTACVDEFEYNMSGHWGCELHEAATEAVEHEVICKKGDSLMYVDKNAGRYSMLYKQKIKLVSGKKWSAV